MERFDQFKSAHLQCLDLCTETDVANILIEHFDSCQKNFVEFQEGYTQWITAGQRPTPGDDDRSYVIALRRKTDYGLQEQNVL